MVLKNKIYILSFLLFLMMTRNLQGQLSVTMAHRQSAENATLAVPIIVGFPSGNTFSTEELSKQFPDAKIPVEKIEVRFPDLTGAIDTAAILWYLKPENYSAKGEVNIVLVTVNADSVKTFYIDNNNDRTFGDNEEKFTFGKDVEKRIVQIKILGNFYNYTLINPDYSPPVSGPSKTKFYSEEWIKSSRKLSVGFDFSLITGGGDAMVSTKPSDESIKSHTYQANIVGAIKPAIGLDLSMFNFHVTPFVAFERLQYDETILREIIFLSDGKELLRRYYSRGTWPTAKLHWGLLGEYDIRIRLFYITPFASYSRFINLNEKNFDKAVVPADGAAYRDMYTKEFGAKLKVPIGNKTMIYIKYAYSQTYFDVSDYILPYEPGTYKVDYTQNFFGMGIQYRITK